MQATEPNEKALLGSPVWETRKALNPVKARREAIVGISAKERTPAGKGRDITGSWVEEKSGVATRYCLELEAG